MALLPAYIVTENLIEYHWLTDANPRVFQLGLAGALARQMVIVKFGGVVVKGAAYAHAKVIVTGNPCLTCGERFSERIQARFVRRNCTGCPVSSPVFG